MGPKIIFKKSCAMGSIACSTHNPDGFLLEYENEYNITICSPKSNSTISNSCVYLKVCSVYLKNNVFINYRHHNSEYKNYNLLACMLMVNNRKNKLSPFKFVKKNLTKYTTSSRNKSTFYDFPAFLKNFHIIMLLENLKDFLSNVNA